MEDLLFWKERGWWLAVMAPPVPRGGGISAPPHDLRAVAQVAACSGQCGFADGYRYCRLKCVWMGCLGSRMGVHSDTVCHWTTGLRCCSPSRSLTSNMLSPNQNPPLNNVLKRPFGPLCSRTNPSLLPPPQPQVRRGSQPLVVQNVLQHAVPGPKRRGADQRPPYIEGTWSAHSAFSKHSARALHHSLQGLCKPTKAKAGGRAK
ncbi:hypothetical protein EJ06DRAFT_274978 [Trichodelitschia bisporula]|uniref:Uncharacterized protein n=1 Tax=Trichodelitschia bisporula TaxID=703511 RepID=A0A6G1I532_9PEZI|nr:hypothetical protein EJ06DRAFT_274978 [Trichodelitschia bisporula]